MFTDEVTTSTSEGSLGTADKTIKLLLEFSPQWTVHASKSEATRVANATPIAAAAMGIVGIPPH